MKRFYNIIIIVILIILQYDLVLAEDYNYIPQKLIINVNNNIINDGMECYYLADKATENTYQLYIPFEDYIQQLGGEFKWIDIYYEYDGDIKDWAKYEGYYILNDTKYYFTYSKLYKNDIDGIVNVYTYENRKMIEVQLDLLGSGGTIDINNKVYIRQEALAWLLQYEGYLTQIDNINKSINIKSYDLDDLKAKLKSEVPNIQFYDSKYIDIYDFIMNTRSYDNFYIRNGKSIISCHVIPYPQEMDTDTAIELFKRGFFDNISEIASINCVYNDKNDWYIITGDKNKPNLEKSKMIIRKFDGAILYCW